MNTCDQALERFNDYQSQYESYKNEDISESDTRSKLIDALLIGVLGWSEEDIRREGHVDSGYYDYKIDIAGVNLVIEAKRQYKEFILPKGLHHSKLSTLYKENEEVIKQIKDYLDDLGRDTGIITNGYQFIIAKFVNTNGIPWKNNTCQIYNGLDDIRDNFIDFWNNLSKSGIISNGGIKCLFSETKDFSKTILSTIPQKDNEISRNDLASSLTPLISKVFGEIFQNDDEINDQDFIRECYVENKEVIKNKAELNGLFSDDAPQLKEVAKARNHKSISKQVKFEINKEQDIHPSNPTPKPIIIIGSKGAGKTTFINFLFNNLEETTINKHPYVIVNLMNYYSGDNHIDTKQIAANILAKINDKYPERTINNVDVLKRIYRREINENDKGIWQYVKENNYPLYQEKLSSFLEERVKDVQKHLIALNLYFIKEIHRRMIIVFDNADQLSDEIQEQIFLYSCSLNTEGKIATFISLREGYYYKFRNKPPFNAFESNVYHIAAPDYGLVLQKRIDYAIKSIPNQGIGSVSGPIDDKMYNLEGSSIISFFNGIRDSLFGTENSPILDFIRFTTFPDIREGLRIFKTFLTSGYTNVSEYVLRVLYNKDKHIITIPIHEFAQAVGLENKLYYNHETSLIQNLFYPLSPESDYFIRINILRKLVSIRNLKGITNSFIPVGELKDLFKEYGYRASIINQELAYLLEYGFIDADKKLSDIKWYRIEDDNLSLTITSKGYYYVTDIINNFYYIDMVLQDTPFFNQDVFNQVKTNFAYRNSEHKRDITKRLLSVKTFMSYLKDEEIKTTPQAIIRSLGSVVDQIYSGKLTDDVCRIEKSVTKKYD